MNVAAQNQIIEKALTLPRNVRERLLRQLRKSLEPVEEELSQEEWDKSWKAELESRIADIECGKVKCIPHEEVRNRIDRILRRA
jgi:putative addiction module component (TIGR02574 family)